MGARTALRTCPLCEALCGLVLTLDGAGAVTDVRGDEDDPFSKGFICPKGAMLGRLDGDPDRLTGALVRDGEGGHAPTSWESAFTVVRREIGDLIARYGTDAVAIYVGDPTSHSIAGPLYTGAIVKALGTRNVYSASTADQMPKHVSSGHMFGDPLAIPVPDLDRTDHLLVLGADPLKSNGSLCSAPDFRGRLKAIQARGGKVTVIDPRRTRTAALADEHMFIRPGTDAFLLMALVHTLFAEELIVPAEHLAGRVNGLDDLRALAVDFPPERVAIITGVPAADARRTARELAAAGRAAVYGRAGTCTQAFGTLSSWLVDALNVLTGNLDRPGGAMFPRPAHVPVYRRKRPFTTGRWRSRVRGLPEVNGELPVATLATEIETPGEGRIRALITIGGNPVLSAPNGARLERALAGLDFMVSVDPYLNETTRHAHVVLPPPRPAQTPHYDIALTRFAVRDYARFSPPAVPPDGRPSEADLLIRLAMIASGSDGDPAALDEVIIRSALARAAALDGSPVHGRAPDELRTMLDTGTLAEQRLDLMLRLGPYGDGFGADPSGLTLTRLRTEHPHGLDLGALKPRLDEVLCTTSGRIELCPSTFAADVGRLHAALADPAAGMVLIGRRQLRSNYNRLHSALRDSVPELVQGSTVCTLQLNPADAARIGVAAGDTVRVVSRTGAIEAVAEPTDTVMPGVASADAVTGDREIDPLSGNAVFNGVPVTLEPGRPGTGV
ncbi:molybdopterin-dependent oxidoreductase [Actinomadura macra]|uniref:molybdopterin-dependent oxidoreductase n=1 Tax=Actinomadura macra TaxID=46164 RepID=UPI00082BB6D6|nr:molybdopterin-dependent oxidoreductase [Actinomadura macra]